MLTEQGLARTAWVQFMQESLQGVFVARVKHRCYDAATVSSVGFSPAKPVSPLERLRKAYRLCHSATNNIERSREQGRATRSKAEYLAKAIVNLREIQKEIEQAGIDLKAATGGQQSDGAD